MKNKEDKEKDIRQAINKSKDYSAAIVFYIASCISSNQGGEEERLLEICIALRMIENIRLTDLAKYVATHYEDADEDTIFNLWWSKATEIISNTTQ